MDAIISLGFSLSIPLAAVAFVFSDRMNRWVNPEGPEC